MGLKGDECTELYSEFILKFDAKINQLQLVQILCLIGRKQADAAATASLLSSGAYTAALYISIV